jgi:acyl transferase domain-containing protein
MLAVKEDISKIEPVLKQFPKVSIANFNSPTQIVLAGPKLEIQKVQDACEKLGYSAILLPVSAAFHTPLIAFAQKSFAIATKSVTFQNPQIPVFSNVTGRHYPHDATAIQKNLESHLASSVLFKQEIENIYGAGGYCFVEFGPKRVLSNLVKDILGDRPHLTISLNPSASKNSDRSLREAAVQLRVIGMNLGNLDPYKLPAILPPIATKKTLSVKLTGINYISDKTKNAFTEALQDGHKISRGAGPAPNSAEPAPKVAQVQEFKSLEIETPVIAKIPTTNGHNGNGNGHKKQPLIETQFQLQHQMTTTATIQKQSSPELFAPQSSEKMQTPDKLINCQQILTSLEQLLSQFQHNQSENLEVHSTYLNHQIEYAKTFFQLMQQQNTLFANAKSSAQAAQIKQVIMESLERSMIQFHSQQGETLRIHEQYLREQIEYTKHFFQLIQEEYSQLISDTQEIAPANVSVTPEEAPVPPTATITPPQPLPVIEPKVQIAEPVIAAQVIEPEPIIIPQSPVAFVPEPTPVTSNLNLDDLANNLLSITSEKTGYPIEMLELDMDMEADLGIDSIKRVEILGGLQELYPNLPKPNLEELAEKRTIGQVVEYLVKGDRLQVTGDSLEVIEEVEAKQVTEEVIPEPVSIPQSPVPSNEYADLGQTLLNITSEKTGYPVEMLELDMDMEADLGIDSIKRVEILGAMQEAYPDLPKPNIEELGDLRTIGQIVNYLQSLVGGEKKKPHIDVNPVTTTTVGAQGLRPLLDLTPPPIVDINLPRRPVQLRTLPRPDFLEAQLPEGHIALITDDGSLTTSKVVHALIEQGWKVVVLSFPQSLVPEQLPLPASVTRVTLANMSEQHLQLLLQSVTTKHGPIGAFIHLHPQFTPEKPGHISYPEAEKAILKQVFLMAKHLKATLNNAASLPGRTSFCTVAHLDGEFGLGHQGNFSAIAAGLFGLTKSLRWEWPQVFFRAIDLNPSLDHHESAQYIVAELHDSNRYIGEVGYGNQRRVTLVAKAE